MYEYGEIIQVKHFGKWVDEIYIGPGIDGSVLVVANADIESFKEGKTFSTNLWIKHRKKPKTVTIGDREVPAPSRSGDVGIDLGSFTLYFDSEGHMEVFMTALEDLRC